MKQGGKLQSVQGRMKMQEKDNTVFNKGGLFCTWKKIELVFHYIVWVNFRLFQSHMIALFIELGNLWRTAYNGIWCTLKQQHPQFSMKPHKPAVSWRESTHWDTPLSSLPASTQVNSPEAHQFDHTRSADWGHPQHDRPVLHSLVWVRLDPTLSVM